MVKGVMDEHSLSARLLQKHAYLDHLSVQTTRIASVEHELKLARGDKWIDIRNEAIWESLLDSRDGLLLRLVSFGKSLHGGEDSLLKEISEARDYPKRFRVDAVKLEETEDHFREMRLARRKRMFKLLFPDVLDDRATPEGQHFLRLGQRCVKPAIERIRHMRNQAAHPYEITPNNFRVDFEELKAVVERYQEIVDAMLTLVTGFDRDMHAVALGQEDLDVREMIDLVVFGTAAMLETDGNRLGASHPIERREKMYAFLHATSEALGNATLNHSEVLAKLPLSTSSVVTS